VIRNPDRAPYLTILTLPGLRGEQLLRDALLHAKVVLEGSNTELLRGDLLFVWKVGTFIYDGEKLIEVHEDHIPPEFPIIEEFPIHYWDNYERGAQVTFDHTPYIDEMLDKLHFEEDWGPFTTFGGKVSLEKYAWTSFTVRKEIVAPSLTRDAEGILSPDSKSTHLQSQFTTYYVIFTGPTRPTLRQIKKLLSMEAYTVPFESGVGTEVPPKLKELENYVVYVNAFIEA